MGTGSRDGSARSEQIADDEDARQLYDKLRSVFAPLYLGERERWVHVMRHAIALNASFFNTHRMVQQYAASAYL